MDVTPAEQPFLDAIRSNPADDTPRLVYADWLDEHGQPAKAEYLRRAVALTGPVDVDGAETRALLAVGAELDADWRLKAGDRFDVILAECKPEYMIGTIKALREATHADLAEAKRAMYTLPYCVFTFMPFESAVDVAQSLRTVNALVDIRPSGGRDGRPFSAIRGYQISACVGTGSSSMGLNYAEERARIQALSGPRFREFVGAALEIALDHAAQQIQDERAVLAPLLHPFDVPNHLPRWRQLATTFNNPARDYFIHVTAHPIYHTS